MTTMSEIGVCAGPVDAAAEHSLFLAEWAIPDDDVDGCWIPTGLDTMEPNPALAAYLSAIDVKELTGHDRVVVLRAHQRMASHYQAHLLEDLAAIKEAIERSEDYEDLDPEYTGLITESEIRVALHLTKARARSQLSLAMELRERLPAVLASLRSGAIDVIRAAVFDRETLHLPRAVARDIVDRYLVDSGTLTTGELSARLKRAAAEFDPADAAERYERALRDRRVVLSAEDSGTARIAGRDLPADRAAAATTYINTHARRLKGQGDDRSMDQLRADVLLDLLAGADVEVAGASAAVEVRADLTTLTGESDGPGHIPGFGPVVAEVVRDIVDRQQGPVGHIG